MPTKTTKKGKQGAARDTENVPVKSQESIGVRECLVWDRRTKGDTSRAQQANDSQRESRFLIKKGELGKTADRGYVYPEDLTYRDPEDDGTVIEALRGWPGLQRQREEEEEKTEETCQEQQRQDRRGKRDEGDPRADPPMVYLVAHKYLNDFERKKLEAAEAERQRELAKRKPVDFAALSELKGTKTSQLRAIHLANQKQVDPKDLWKMKKFTRAKTCLDTNKKGARSKKGPTAGAETKGATTDGACTTGLNVNKDGQRREEAQAADSTRQGYDYLYVPYSERDRQQQDSPELAF